jgi:molybdate/tungstate transport system ATP-binding protein
VISVEHLNVRVGAFTLEDITFTVPVGSFAVLMGRSGAGKTTLMEAICGLRTIAGGNIRLYGRDVTHLKPADRGIGYVPQDVALFSTMTVRQNLAFALEIRKFPRAAIDQRVAELAEFLGLTDLLERRARGLSGGEAQRVALGRALACRPSILCLDEPLSALDEEIKEEMYTLLQSIQAREGVTTLHVTHSREDAGRLANVIFRIAGGKVTL